MLKQVRTKTTGLSTIDLFYEVWKGNMSDSQINVAHQVLTERMAMDANVFFVLDGSGSMTSSLTEGSTSWGAPPATTDTRFSNISLLDALMTLAIPFITRNPEPTFRNCFAWFANDVHIIGDTVYKDTRPNSHLSRSAYRVQTEVRPVLSENKTFIENLKSLKQSNPSDAHSTNMMKIVELFVKLVKDNKLTVEQLPSAICWITDAELNSGINPDQAKKLCHSIGWDPLFIIWALRMTDNDIMKKFMNEAKNALFLGGFNESSLTNVLSNINKSIINPADVLWSRNDDPRYSVVKNFIL